MTITIKNDEVERKVRELARRTERTLTGAIADAVTRDLATRETREARRVRLAALTAELQQYARTAPGRLLTDDDLYDDSGLPR